LSSTDGSIMFIGASTLLRKAAITWSDSAVCLRHIYQRGTYGPISVKFGFGN
jgi:hypothetical protein